MSHTDIPLNYISSHNDTIHTQTTNTVLGQSFTPDRQVTLNYLEPRRKPNIEHAQCIYFTILNLKGNNSFDSSDKLLKQLLIDYEDIRTYAEQVVQKQIVDYTSLIPLYLNNQLCSSYADVSNVWASQDGLNHYHDIWQVRKICNYYTITIICFFQVLISCSPNFLNRFFMVSLILVMIIGLDFKNRSI